MRSRALLMAIRFFLLMSAHRSDMPYIHTHTRIEREREKQLFPEEFEIEH